MKRITYFLSGALAALLISSATVSAFAAGGLITLNVQPAQVMVNGEVFQPKDAQGRDALVFTYNGTTYAPVRALAEAYGLTVGYDSAKNMATVDGAARPPIPLAIFPLSGRSRKSRSPDTVMSISSLPFIPARFPWTNSKAGGSR